MKKSESSPVFGQTAPGSKITLAAAVLLAAVISVPVFLILTVIDLIWL